VIFYYKTLYLDYIINNNSYPGGFVHSSPGFFLTLYLIGFGRNSVEIESYSPLRVVKTLQRIIYIPGKSEIC